MTRKGFFPLFCVTASIITCVLAVTIWPQGRREIVSDDFTKPRPTPTPRPGRPGNAGIIANKRRAPPAPTQLPTKRYRFAGASSPNTPPLSATDNIEQLGLTLWRLRPAKEMETGQRMVVREKNGLSQWIPERIEMDTPLRTGDRVRLSIESPREGYLYVIDRDLYGDSKLGEAVLLFPSRGVDGGHNQVRPGRLIDLPASEPSQEDTSNYFTARPSRSDQVGKILTIIVTSRPLEVAIGARGPISPVDLTKWEKSWGTESERFEMEGGDGKAWTREEKEAASANSLRQLTQDDPSPQTIYRIASKNKTAFLIDVRLNYGK